MKTTMHLNEDEIRNAVVLYLRENGKLAAAGNVTLRPVDEGGEAIAHVEVNADVTECEDAPKRGRKAAKAEG